MRLPLDFRPGFCFQWVLPGSVGREPSVRSVSTGRETTLTESLVNVNTWQQLSLLPPGRTTITLTVTIDPQHDHAHYAVEVRDSDTLNLIGMHVAPSRRTSAWTYDYDAITERIRVALGALIDPF